MSFFTIARIRALFLAGISGPLSIGMLSTTVASQDALPTAGQLTAQHVNASGGRDAILSRRVSRSSGTFEMASVGLKGDLVIVTQAPDRMATRISIPGVGDMLSGYDGSVGWSVEPLAGPRVLSGGELEAMRENANALASVRDASLLREMQTIERTVSEGEPCYRVRLVWRSGRETHDCYHADTGLLIETEQDVESPMGIMRVVAALSNYRDFGGVLLPTRTSLSIMGSQQVLNISTVEFEDIDTSVIAPPEVIRRLRSSIPPPEAGGRTHH